MGLLQQEMWATGNARIESPTTTFDMPLDDQTHIQSTFKASLINRIIIVHIEPGEHDMRLSQAVHTPVALLQQDILILSGQGGGKICISDIQQ